MKRPRKAKLVTRKLKKFLLGGEAVPLRPDDFRSARLTIPPRAFAYVQKIRVLLDPVDLETWTELQAAPDDFCIQTTGVPRQHAETSARTSRGLDQDDRVR